MTNATIQATIEIIPLIISQNIINKIPDKELGPNGYDSKAFINLQLFRRNPQAENNRFLTDAISAYTKAIENGVKSKFTSEGISLAAKLLNQYGDFNTS